MNRDKKKQKEFYEILENFSLFIRANIQNYYPQKHGIDPDDIFQEVKIKIWKILSNEKKIKNYPSYIKKIINSSIIDQLRKLRRERGIILQEQQNRISEKEINYDMDKTIKIDSKEILGQAVDSLIESRRIVVKLFLLNMRIDEIAIFLNWSKNKTRNLLYRGLADLKRKLITKGINYEK